MMDKTTGLPRYSARIAATIDRIENFAGSVPGSFLASIILFIYYILHTPLTILWFDTAELTAASCSLGLSHPPGQALYHILAYIFMVLPFGGSAFKANLFSGFCLASAAFFVNALFVHFLLKWLRINALHLIALLLTLACCSLYSIAIQGIRVEVYGFAFFLNLTTIALYSRYRDDKPLDLYRRVILVSTVLSLQTHLLAGMIVVTAIIVDRLFSNGFPEFSFRKLRFKRFLSDLLFVVLALSPLAYFIVRLDRNTIIHWALIEDGSTMIRFILGGYYFDNFGFSAIHANVMTLLEMMNQNFPVTLLIIAPAALVLIYRRERRDALFIGILLILPLLAVLPLSRAYPDNPDLHGYIMVALVPVVLLFGYFFLTIIKRMSMTGGLGPILGSGAVILCILLMLKGSLAIQSSSGEKQELLAYYLHKDLAQNSLLFFNNDDYFFSLIYLQNCYDTRWDVLPLGKFTLKYLENYRRHRRVFPQVLPELPAPSIGPLAFEEPRHIMGEGFFAWQVNNILQHLPPEYNAYLQPGMNLYPRRESFVPDGLLLRFGQAHGRYNISDYLRIFRPVNDGYERHGTEYALKQNPLEIMTYDSDPDSRLEVAKQVERLFGSD